MALKSRCYSTLPLSLVRQPKYLRSHQDYNLPGIASFPAATCLSSHPRDGGLGVVEVGGVDVAIAGLDEAEEAEGEEAERRERQEHPAIGLLAQSLQCAAQAMDLRGGGMERGKNQEAADHQEDHSARCESHAAEGDEPVPLVGRQGEAVRHPAAPGFRDEGETRAGDGKADQAHQPLAEGLAHEPGRPVLGGLILATASRAAPEGQVQGKEAEARIDDAADQVRTPDAPTLHVGTAMVGVRERLQNPPGAEAEEAKRDQDEPDLAEGLREQGLQGAAAAAGLAARADGGQERQGADEAINHASRAIAEPGQSLDGMAADLRHGR
jgi:hypothetical protein